MEAFGRTGTVDRLWLRAVVRLLGRLGMLGGWERGGDGERERDEDGLDDFAEEGDDYEEYVPIKQRKAEKKSYIQQKKQALQKKREVFSAPDKNSRAMKIFCRPRKRKRLKRKMSSRTLE